MFKTKLSAVLAMMLIVAFGCQNETENPQPVTGTPDNQTTNTEEVSKVYEYRLDGEVVPEGTYKMEDPELQYAITQEPNQEETGYNLIVDAFTNDDVYIAWGNDRGYDVASMLEYERSVSKFAEESGAIQQYEETGEVSQEYLDFQNAEYERIFETRPVTNGRTMGPGYLFSSCSGGSVRAMNSVMPWMWWGWNNTVSRYYHSGGWRYTVMYDRTFFRRRIATIWGGYDYYNFCYYPWINNRMSSGWTVGW